MIVEKAHNSVVNLFVKTVTYPVYDSTWASPDQAQEHDTEHALQE